MLLPPELIKYILKIKNRNHVKEYMETMDLEKNPYTTYLVVILNPLQTLAIIIV